MMSSMMSMELVWHSTVVEDGCWVGMHIILKTYTMLILKCMLCLEGGKNHQGQK